MSSLRTFTLSRPSTVSTWSDSCESAVLSDKQNNQTNKQNQTVILTHAHEVTMSLHSAPMISVSLSDTPLGHLLKLKSPALTHKAQDKHETDGGAYRVNSICHGESDRGQKEWEGHRYGKIRRPLC